ncbi:MAG: hypothetical protein MJ224_00105 [archaeon]|nr:hypothetical protein [archaeon]
MIDEFEIQFEKGYNTLLDSAKLNDQIKVRYDDGATKYTVTAVVSTKETSKNKPTYIVLSPLMDEAIEYDSHGGSGGTDDYNDLTNKPKINDVTLSGNKSLSDLGIAAEDDIIDDYEDLDNIPSINGVDLKGNKTQSDLKLDTLPSGNSLPSGEYNGQIFVLLQDSGDTEKGIYRYNLNL